MKMLPLSALLALLTVAGPARADPRACISAHEAGVTAQQAGSLLKAVEKFSMCSKAACPGVIRQECDQRLAQAIKDMPTVVFAATDAKGADLIRVRVSVDGKTVAEHLDGRAVELDPGAHLVRFERPDGTAKEDELVARVGEKNRKVSVKFDSTTSPAKTAPATSPNPMTDSGTTSSGPPFLAYALAGVGVVALGSFTYFALDGKSKQSDLEDKCAPYCGQSGYDDMKKSYLIADVSLGVAAVSLGLATYLFLSPSASSGPEKTATRVGIAPLPGGFALGAHTRF